MKRLPPRRTLLLWPIVIEKYHALILLLILSYVVILWSLVLEVQKQVKSLKKAEQEGRGIRKVPELQTQDWRNLIQASKKGSRILVAETDDLKFVDDSLRDFNGKTRNDGNRSTKKSLFLDLKDTERVKRGDEKIYDIWWNFEYTNLCRWRLHWNNLSHDKFWKVTEQMKLPQQMKRPINQYQLKKACQPLLQIGCHNSTVKIYVAKTGSYSRDSVSPWCQSQGGCSHGVGSLSKRNVKQDY